MNPLHPLLPYQFSMIAIFLKLTHKDLYVAPTFLGFFLAALYKLLIFVTEGGLVACRTEKGGFGGGGKVNSSAVRGTF